MRTWLLIAVAAIAQAQDFTQRGFLDLTGIGYPQHAPNDSGRATVDALFRYEAFYKLGSGLRVAGGIDTRADTHQQVERTAHFSLWDRERQRPALELRRLSVSYSRGKLTFEVGKQFIHWGKADIVTPTDRFAPQDYLTVIDAEPLAITAGRLTYGTRANSIDLIYAPRLTPSRIPLVNQRWAVRSSIPIREMRADIPGGPQWGARWNHTGTAEYSLSFYQGYDYFPLFRVRPEPAQPVLNIQRFYPQLRMYSGDAAVPLSVLSLKAEAAYFTSGNTQSDEYVIYVLQLERHTGEWSFVGGYAGEVVTEHRSTAGFSPLRGFSRALIGRAAYSIDVNRSFSMEGAVRQNGRGVLLKPEYTQAFGQHWRFTFGLAWIHGSVTDFIGQYRRNHYATLKIRYSF